MNGIRRKHDAWEGLCEVLWQWKEVGCVGCLRKKQYNRWWCPKKKEKENVTKKSPMWWWQDEGRGNRTVEVKTSFGASGGWCGWKPRAVGHDEYWGNGWQVWSSCGVEFTWEKVGLSRRTWSTGATSDGGGKKNTLFFYLWKLKKNLSWFNLQCWNTFSIFFLT